MKNGFYIYNSVSQINPVKNTAAADGEKCGELKAFVSLLAENFSFPEYFSDNLDSLEEILNDMSWLHDNSFAIIISNYAEFLKSEKPARKAELLSLLAETASQWQHVPNYPGEEAYRDRADFRVYIEQCPQATEDLEELDIPVQGYLA
ncbi:barstar family protein [Pedobacter antarcticus]|uniref:barstar family protein n=1 Tax=Pedobacter antarcticus TaxID=34086 RepID=UPI001C56DFEC|nr:barstar family protein [Pedobacter antarcticus]